MTRSSLRALALGVAAASSLSLVACGDDDSESGSSSSSGASPKAEAPAEGKQGGVLEQSGSSDVDYLDPGHTYYTGGYQIAFATGRPLYGFKPGEEQPVPDLAEGEPQIAEDAKSITVKIKPNVKFGPP
jgi:peptide/nickel transport system substrate-binding protein